MRNLILTLFSFVLFTSAVQANMSFDDTQSFQMARVVKIGRSNAELSTDSTALSSSGGYTENSEVDYVQCGVANCKTCNFSTHNCTMCESGYYLSNNVCVSCPSNATCSDGKVYSCNNLYYDTTSGTSGTCTAICTNVTCVSGATKKAYNTYCACE